jgi:ankyrin repeat protein
MFLAIRKLASRMLSLVYNGKKCKIRVLNRDCYSTTFPFLNDEDFLNLILVWRRNNLLKNRLCMQMIGRFIKKRNCTSINLVSWAIKNGINPDEITLVNCCFDNVDSMKIWFNRRVKIPKFKIINRGLFDRSITTLLGQACKNEDINIIHALLTYRYCKIDDICDCHGNKAIHLAAMHGQKKTIIVLKKYGADINTRSNKGVTPLMYAVKYRHLTMVKWLVKNGAIVNSVDNFNQNAMSYISFLNRKRLHNENEIYSLLLKKLS